MGLRDIKGFKTLKVVNGVAELPSDFACVKAVYCNNLTIPFCNKNFLYYNVDTIYENFSSLPQWYTDENKIYILPPPKYRYMSLWQRILRFFKTRDINIFTLEYVTIEEYVNSANN